LRIFIVEYAENVLLHPGLHSTGPERRRSAQRQVSARVDLLKKHQLTRTVEADLEQEARLISARARRLIDSGVAALNDLDDAAADLRRTNTDRASRSDAKLMEFRFSVYAELRPDELTSDMTENWLNDAIWYARVSYKIRRQAVAPILDAARREAEQLKLFAAYERNWLKAAILSSPLDKRVSDWYLALLMNYRRQLQSASADPNQSAAARTSAADELDELARDLQGLNRVNESKQLKEHADAYRKGIPK
jgi:hypothetical protein